MARPKRLHWLSQLGQEVASRMSDTADEIAAGLLDRVPYGMPPEAPRPPDLNSYLQASPDERLAYIHSLSPQDYKDFTTHMMTEANARWGAMAAPLQRMFQGDAAQVSMADLAAAQQQPNLGTAAAQADLIDLFGGVNPFGDV